MKKKLIFSITLFLMVFLPYKVNALCSDSEIIRLQNIAKNINYSYEYDETEEKFSITFTNLNDEIIIRSSTTGRSYNGIKEIKINDFISGNYKFNIYAKDNKCTKDILATKYIELPYYNVFYNSELCDGINNYSYCQKWQKNSVSYDVWYSKVTKYRNSIKEVKKEEIDNSGLFDKIGNIIMKFYVNYYYIILPLIIIILCSIIYAKNKKEELV